MKKDKELKSLGERVREIRLSKGLTQSDLASNVNKDQQSIQRLESGNINPSYLYLLEISEGLGVSITKLLEK